MHFVDIFLISLALAADAFAVAVCIGIGIKTKKIYPCIIVGLYFGLFQTAMPVVGYFAGNFLAARITMIDHWVTFALLTLIGANIIFSAIKGDDGVKNLSLAPLVMVPLAVATSIDAMAIGISFAFDDTSILLAAITIGVVAFALSILGVRCGDMLGEKFKTQAAITAGVVLITMGVRSLVLHL